MKYILNVLILNLVILFAGCSKQELLTKAIEYERSDSSMELESLQLSFGEIAFLENSTKSDSTVVLLHGFGGDKDNWNSFNKELEDRYHIIAIDLLGHGESSLSKDNNYTLSNQVSMLNEFLLAKNINTIHLVGNSMGGAIALLYSYKYSKDVKTLTLIDALGMKTTDSELDIEISDIGKNPFLNICSEESFYNLLHFGMEKPPYVPGIFIDLLVYKKCQRKELEKIIYKQIYEDSNLSVVTQNINTKTLIIWGDKDRILHLNNAHLFHKSIKNSKLVVLENIGHVPQLESPEITAKTFLNFVDN